VHRSAATYAHSQVSFDAKALQTDLKIGHYIRTKARGRAEAPTAHGGLPRDAVKHCRVSSEEGARYIVTLRVFCETRNEWCRSSFFLS